MLVYIVHAEADQAAADDLKAFLKSRGLIPQRETGERGFAHLQPSDVVIALWSEKSVFAAHRMQIEGRMLDAWADGRLVLVKLDHGVLPVGVRDLPAIDASFESNRQLAVWPQVERAAKEAMNRALVEKQRAEEELGRLNSRYGDMTKAMGEGAKGGGPRRLEIDEEEVAANGRGGAGGWIALAFLAGLGALGWAGWVAFLNPEANPLPEWATISIAAIGGMLVLGVIVVGLVGAMRRPPKRAARGNPALHSMDKMLSEVEAPAAVPAPTAVFISYAHADDAAVGPVVKLVEANGRTVWIDKTGIHTGDGWAGEIVRAIKGAKGVLVMCSKHAFESDHIKREVYLADRYKKPMAPVFLEAAQPPEDFEYFFAGVQWLELYKLPEGDRAAAIGRALASV